MERGGGAGGGLGRTGPAGGLSRRGGVAGRGQAARCARAAAAAAVAAALRCGDVLSPALAKRCHCQTNDTSRVIWGAVCRVLGVLQGVAIKL
jgi:hypothetical protein